MSTQLLYGQSIMHCTAEFEAKTFTKSEKRGSFKKTHVSFFKRPETAFIYARQLRLLGRKSAGQRETIEFDEMPSRHFLLQRSNFPHRKFKTVLSMNLVLKRSTPEGHGRNCGQKDDSSR
jgi:hypothetical protein